MKRRTRKIVVGALVCTMVVSGTHVGTPYGAIWESSSITYAQEKTEAASESSFVFDKETGTITKYKGSESGKLIIPEKIGGVQVKVIGEAAFQEIGENTSKIQLVVLPDGLERIEGGAFHGRDLQSITIPESVTFIEGKK